jgi:ribonuclease Z
MQIFFLGTGEASDENYYNNSFLIGDKTKILVDCGYSIPVRLWSYQKDPDFIDYIYISHTHADHFFGLPALVLRLNEDGRKKPLSIICPRGFARNIKDLCNLGYPGILEKIKFVLDFNEIESSQELFLSEFKLSFAVTRHSMKNLAVSFESQNVKIGYSGDGNFTQNSSKLFQRSDLLIHDGYSFHQTENHAEISEIIELAKNIKVKTLALTHVQRKTRNSRLFENKIRHFQEECDSLRIIVPKPGYQKDF